MPVKTEAQLHASLVNRYNKLVIRNQTGCWGWQRPVGNQGYPDLVFGPHGKVRMNRFSYELHVGPIPAGLWVLHHCDNKVCTRPDHLYLGDQADNGADIRMRGTSLKDRCRKGHPMTPDNLYERTDRRGYAQRICRQCQRERGRRWMAATRAAAAIRRGS